MKFSQIWCMIVVLLSVFSGTVSFLAAQTEEPAAVHTPSSAEVQSSSDEPEQEPPTLATEGVSSSTEKQVSAPASREITSRAADVETESLSNELWRELLDYRAKMIDWWLATTAIFLTLLGVSAALLGYFGFKKLDTIESEAQRLLEEIRSIHAESDMYRESVRSILFMLQGRKREAVEKLRSIASRAEGTDDDLAADSWFSVGYLLLSKGDFKGAMDAYDKALRLHPSYAKAYNNRGKSKFFLNQYDEALVDYDEALRLDPDHANAYYNRGEAKDQLQRIDEARQDFEKARDLAQSEGDEKLMQAAEDYLERLGESADS